ncbi:MAG: hypothetical protein EZS28_001837 [Streblomastix strix]|uniref:Uncharacterized protein n=1 Tax=Streblomastix strix TaxID=222440 RepID=A0A5J4X650_9EUKA|nr:MAG: hypothetical protein EZS28_001837 [Streblomastix strix]
MWANYTGTFNDANAIPIEKVNRRFQQLTCNNEFAGNRKYFNDLCNNIKPTQQDIKEFNAEDFIVEVDKKTDVENNDQLERQCSSNY